MLPAESLLLATRSLDRAGDRLGPQWANLGPRTPILRHWSVVVLDHPHMHYDHLEKLALPVCIRFVQAMPIYRDLEIVVLAIVEVYWRSARVHSLLRKEIGGGVDSDADSVALNLAAAYFDLHQVRVLLSVEHENNSVAAHSARAAFVASVSAVRDFDPVFPVCRETG